MRRFILRIIIGVLAFVIGITGVMLIGKVNPFRHSHSHCAERSWNPPPPPPPAPVAPDEPPPPPPPPSMNKTDGGNAQPRAR